MTTKTATKKTSLHPCLCSLFDFDVWIDEEGNHSDGYDTHCSEMTHRTFAQGHDAKLAGFLVRAEAQGHDIRRVDGGVAIVYTSAVDAALKISDALGAKVEAMQIAQAKRAARRKVTKTPTQAMNDLVERQTAAILAPVTRDAKIKVGRWTYDAIISLKSERASFITKSGETKVADKGTYTEIA